MWFTVCIPAGVVFEGVGVLLHIEQGVSAGRLPFSLRSMQNKAL